MPDGQKHCKHVISVIEFIAVCLWFE